MSLNLQEEYNKTDIQGVIDQLEQDLVGLAPVKARIKEIAALLLVQRLRKNLGLGLNSTSVGLHMSFTGSPGTGKTEVANRMADILFKLGYIRKGHLITVTRDDLVGQYIGHTAPKTKEVLKRAMGGVLFIDEAYYLYKPDNERDYGAEAIGEVSAVTPFRYTRLIFGVTLGIVFFNETLNFSTILGTTFIVISGLFILSRNK